MKLRIFTLIILIGLTVTLGSTRIVAQEQPEDDSAARCRISQNFIVTTIRPRDLRARVDRLQAYRYIYDRLDKFVLRLENNDQPKAAELRESLNSLNNQIENFKEDYEIYDQARQSVATQKNCANNSTAFQEKLEIARVNRQQVATDVSDIQTSLDSTIKNHLEELRQLLLTTGQSGASDE